MARIAFILLAHKAPEDVAAQARALTADGNFVVVHFDKNARTKDWKCLNALLANTPRVVVLARRVRCGWGQWSLCAATLAALRQALCSFEHATHFYLVSGDCVPLTSAMSMQSRLDASNRDHIEVHDFFRSDWIKTGLKAERLVYRHWFNERKSSGWFYLSLRLQQLFGLERSIPDGIRPRIGSQWWCLRRSTVEAVCGFARNRRRLVRFFRSVWIPDETFFQTMVAHLVPAAEITNKPPTCLHFTDYGMPIVFHDDHVSALASETAFFARKASPNAGELRRTLWARYEGKEPAVQSAGEESGGIGTLLHLASRGRQGRRVPPAPWRTARGDNGRQTIVAIACKQWHLAEQQADLLSSSFENLGFVFDNGNDHLPDLGGFERCVDARRNDPALVLRLAMEAKHTNAVVLCLDPSRATVLERLAAARFQVKLVLLDVELTDGFLAGHGQRLGLPAAASLGPAGQAIRDSLRYEIEDEMRVLQNLPGLSVFREPLTNNSAELSRLLAGFLDNPEQQARDLTPTMIQLEG